ncbi:porin family protein [Agrobacterium vitis]|uniref:Porin family protein n=1 Tax=Agrobacterium vitis TaxID=373 RepID=A0A368NU48_AGRVI|nr:outer membrane protein [Agrobacterium vitis]KAA3519495.1 porin family protein [Agrobacterium vitis]KAA3532294.1 porin family protein [Agrobacterium vitis]MCF1475624.1 porin family protein [Agrobacterium vitis]MUZ95142.1 outer membrane beta-barrel protein [Agrobacterium vitis]MVA29610.1 outer membrane beta-barrel protein [Agrobacterium vitis]
MRTLVMILLASSAGLSLVTGAHAADAVMSVPEAPAAVDMPAPVTNWAGAYVGGAGTYTMGRSHGSKFSARAFGGQVYGGYNMQNDKIVYGGEADIGYDGNGSRSGAGLTGKQGVNGSIRGRVGYDLNPFMVYGTAGVAAADTKISGAGGSDSKAALGYTVGAGVEAMVTNNITTRIEYRYTDYQNKDYDIGGSKVSRGFDDQSVKVGIGMKF